MTQTCSVYGLGVGLNVPVAGLRGLPAPGKIDVRVTLGALPEGLDALADGAAVEWYVSDERNEDGVPAFRVARLPGSGDLRIAYDDGTVVVVDAQGRNVWAAWPPPLTVEDTATYLLGPILGIVLRLRGITCLHASAVAIGGRAVVFVGVSGAGKSSTAAAFARLGYPVLSDDVVALADLGERFEIQPAYPRIRLWPKTVAGLFGAEDALPLITPNWDKRFLPLNRDGYRFQSEPLPLGAVYFLDWTDSPPAIPRVEGVTPREGLMTLISDTFATRYLDRAGRANEFDVLGRLVNQVPLRKINPSGDFSRIDQLCEAVVEDLCRLA